MKSLEELSFAEQREQITVLAAEVGVTLTEDDFRQVAGAELTDEELEKVAGGGMEKMSLETAKEMHLQELIDRISAQ